MRFAVIGGIADLARRGLEKGLEPIVKIESADECESGFETVADYAGFLEAIDYPRIYIMEAPLLGEIDAVIDQAYLTMEPGDVVIDVTPSYWGDTLRRFRRMRHRSIFYIDAALIGAGDRSALALAGDPGGLEIATPLMTALASKNERVVRAGEAGAAHFAAMLDDARRTALKHVAAELQQMIEAYPNAADKDALGSFLIPPIVDSAPRSDWILEDSVRLDAPVPLLAQSIMQDVAGALDDHAARNKARRLGGFVHPDDVL